MSVNTTVLTVDEMDFGAGPQRTHVFVGCTHHVEGDTLHIVSKANGDRGNVAAFPPGVWRAVVRGQIANAPVALGGAA